MSLQSDLYFFSALGLPIVQNNNPQTTHPTPKEHIIDLGNCQAAPAPPGTGPAPQV